MLSLAPYRELLRAFRAHPRGGAILRAPFVGLRALGVRWPERIYRHLHFKGSFTVRVPGGSAFQMVSSGHTVENRTYWRGAFGHEPECAVPWVIAARHSKVVFDIGANTGIFSLLAASSGKSTTVYAFEPLARIANALRQNALLNPHLRIEVVEQAIGRENGTADIFDPGGDIAYSASLHRAFLAADSTSYPVPISTVDSFMQSKRVSSVDLLKIDVEGVEEHVLEGMGECLNMSRPIIMLECLDMRESLIIAIRDICIRGYRIFLPTTAGLVASDTIDPTVSRNAFLIPPLNTPAVRSLERLFIDETRTHCISKRSAAGLSTRTNRA